MAGKERALGTSAGAQRRTGVCGRCGAAVGVDPRPMIGEVFDCGRCGAALEVANLEPLVLEPFARVEEDEEDLREFGELGPL